MDEITNLISLPFWKKNKTLNAHSDQYQNTFITLQHVYRQFQLFNFLISQKSIIKSSFDVLSFLNSSMNPPQRIHKVFSSNVSDIIASWFVAFLNNSELFAEIIFNYFNEFPDEQILFGMVIFPSLYFNFLTEEFQNLAYKFLIKLFDISTPDFFDPFVLSFLNSANHFSDTLWNQYDSLINNNKIEQTIEAHFHALVSALQFSMSLFSQYQNQIIITYLTRFPNDFPKLFLEQFLWNSFFQSHQCYVNNMDNHPLNKILNFAAQHPRSPHCNILMKTLKNSRLYSYIPHWSESGIGHKTPLVLSSHECYLIQKIVRKFPKIAKTKLITAISIPESFQNSIEPLFLTIATLSFIPLSTANEEAIFSLESSHKISDIELSAKFPNPEYPRLWKHYCDLANSSGVSVLDYIQSDKLSKISDEFKSYCIIQIRNEASNSFLELDAFLHRQYLNKYYFSLCSNRKKQLKTLLYSLPEQIHIQFHSDSPIAIFHKPDFILNYEASFSEVALRHHGITSSHFSLKKNLEKNGKSYSFPQKQVSNDIKNLPNKTQTNSQTHFIRPECKIPGRQKKIKCISPIIKNQNNQENKQEINLQYKRRKRVNSVNSNAQEMNPTHMIKDLILSISEVSNFRYIKLMLFIQKINEIYTNWPLEERLNQTYSHLADAARARQLSNSSFFHDQYESYIRETSEMLDQLMFYKRGNSILKISEIGIRLRVVFSSLDKNGKEIRKLFKRMILLSVNNNFYDQILFTAKLFTAFPEIQLFFSQKMLTGIQYIDELFFTFLNGLDPMLANKTLAAKQVLSNNLNLKF